MTEKPAYQSFHRLVIQPQIKILSPGGNGAGVHCAGPVYADFEQQGLARHCRGRGPVDTCPPMPPRKDQIKLREEFLYGGCLTGHYGHFVAEFVHRVVPSLKEFPDLRVIYIGVPGLAAPQMASFAEQVLAYLGLPKDKVLVVDKPVRVRCLHVFPQQECLGGSAPSPEYLADLTQIQQNRFPMLASSDQPVFVSRSKQKKGLAGEVALDELFREAGALIYHPEEHSVMHQLETYLSHRRLLFSEGSALHTLQLLGQVPAQVTVLKRRSGRMGRVFLQSRVRSLEYFSLGSVGLACEISAGRLAGWKGLSFIDPNHLRQVCVSFFPDWAPEQREAALSRVLQRLGELEWQSVLLYIEALRPTIRLKQGADLLGQLKMTGRFSNVQLAELSERFLGGAAPEESDIPVMKRRNKAWREAEPSVPPTDAPTSS